MIKRLDPALTALIVIDVQKGFDTIAAAGTARNNPGAEGRIGALLDTFRAARAPLFHIRHASRQPDSVFAAGCPGCEPISIAAERAGEPVIEKAANSAFIGTGLEHQLREAGIRALVLCGATTNHCVETTARMAGNLGFDTHLVRDATWTFARTGPDGERHEAEAIHQMSLANLAGEFATITTSDAVTAALNAPAYSRRVEP